MIVILNLTKIVKETTDFNIITKEETFNTEGIFWFKKLENKYLYRLAI